MKKILSRGIALAFLLVLLLGPYSAVAAPIGKPISNILEAEHKVTQPSVPGPGSGTGGPFLPPVITPSVTGIIDETGGIVGFEDGSAALQAPPNAVLEKVTVTLAPVTEVTQPTTGMVMIAGKVFEIAAETDDGESVTQFLEPITLTFKLTQEELEEAEIELEDLRVFYWDEKAGAWIALPTRVDPETGTVTALTDHFTVFAVMAKPDMPALSDILGHWGESHILALASLELIHGYPEGDYRPDNNLTRAEAVKIIVSSLKPSPRVDAVPSFTDVIPEWALPFIEAAVKAEIITGYEDGTFRSDNAVSRAEWVLMLIRAGKWTTQERRQFTDNLPIWAKDAIELSGGLGIIEGYPDGSFRPYSDLSRAEAAATIYRAFRSP